MKGFRSVVAVAALVATISVGCSASRGKRCRDGGCRVSSADGPVPPRRTEMTLAQPPDKSPRGKIQQTCPVTGEKLGSMGSPIPVTFGGKSLQVCCQGCVAAVQKNPDKYLKIIADELVMSETSAVRSEVSYNRPAVDERSSQSSGGHHH